MDHETAIRLKACEAYVLKDLSAEERDEFEEHLADCAHCLEDVWLASTFAANARAVFRDRAREPQTARESGWLKWLRWRPMPAISWSAALNVVLCAGLGYQLLHKPAERPALPASVEVVPVHSAVRGPEEAPIVASGPAVVLSFDLPHRYQRYTYSIRPSGGGKAVSGEVTAGSGTDSLNLEIPLARLAPGEYTVAASGWDAGRPDSLGECRLQVPPR